ncbi:MAG: hypothetical protein WB696_04185 [Chthoniobacterales bacterium]
MTLEILNILSKSLRIEMRLVFSTPGMPLGHGRIERFFATISDMLLYELPGFKSPAKKVDRKALLTLAQLDELLRDFSSDA